MNEQRTEVIRANELTHDLLAEAVAVVTDYRTVGSRSCVLVRGEHT